jgi:hypothetical protein
MVEDAYPCTPFQADLFDVSTQAADILHYNFVFKLEDTTPHMVDRICKVFERVHFRNPVLRSRIVQYTDHHAGTRCTAQPHIKEDLKWLEFVPLLVLFRFRYSNVSSRGVIIIGLKPPEIRSEALLVGGAGVDICVVLRCFIMIRYYPIQALL